MGILKGSYKVLYRGHIGDNGKENRSYYSIWFRIQRVGNIRTSTPAPYPKSQEGPLQINSYMSLMQRITLSLMPRKAASPLPKP